MQGLKVSILASLHCADWETFGSISSEDGTSQLDDKAMARNPRNYFPEMLTFSPSLARVLKGLCGTLLF